MEKAQKEQIEKAIVKITEVYGCTAESIERLIELTNENQKVQFVSLIGYNSDKSLNTEVANQVVNINANYGKIVEKSLIELNSDAEMIKGEFDIYAENWDYEGMYNLNGVAEKDFAKQVKEVFYIALEELKHPKVGSRVSNDIWLNKALVFNTNTSRLSIFGTSMSKTVKQEGVFKKVKSAPLTVAKAIINTVVQPKNDKLRRFTMDNLNNTKLQGETLEIGGGQKEGVEIQ